jgi:AcrR family transcriptional regulator
MEETAASKLPSLKRRGIFYKSTFENIPEERRQKIFSVAVSEFAANGYNAANINVIAKKAGISIGSMYSYFESKETLFLAIVDNGFHILEKLINGIANEITSAEEAFRQMLVAARDYAISYPEYNQIYLDFTSQGLSHISSKLSHTVETITAQFYQDIIRRDKEKGILPQEIDEHMLSFLMDNLIITFQFSFTSDYYKERMRIFLGEDLSGKDEKIINGIVNLIKPMLFPIRE